jgi:hypothetical protein
MNKIECKFNMKKAWGSFFLIVFSALTTAQTVEFRVDMGVQAYKGLFNPTTDAVKIAGNFNGWNNGLDVLTDLDGDTIYTITKTFSINEELVFNFIGGNDGWEVIHEREYTVPTGNSIYSAYFNNDSTSLKGQIIIAFACNMEYELKSAQFNSLTDTLSVRGSFNGWSDDWKMTPTIDTNTYEVTRTINAYLGEVFNYKFVYKSPQDTVWENDPNKVYIVTESDISSGFAYVLRTFNNVQYMPRPLYPFTLKFSVDMNGAISAINQEPFTSISDVRICGMFHPFCSSPYYCWPHESWPDSDSVLTTKLYDDGTNGDLSVGDNIWSKDIFFNECPYVEVRYKYSVNWGLPSNNGSNENESIYDHIIYVPINILSGAVSNIFGVMGIHKVTDLVLSDVNDEVSNKLDAYRLEQNYPNPFNPSTKIKFSIPTSPFNPSPYQGEGNRERFVNLKVYDILGNEVATFVDEFKPTGSYEVEFNANAGTRNLASGIYFYQLKVNDPSTSSGQNFIQTKKMIFLK